jgi:DNA-binding Lrp family transcriptional regulator
MMSRTILTNVDGFTPVIDNVMKDTSLIAAVVFGGMWRFCQMKNGVCQATLDKIAQRIGLSRQAVIEHIKTLEAAGYIQDMTPDLRNRPHTYRDTGKAGLHIGLSGVNVVDSETVENDFTVNVVDSAVNVVDSHSTPRVLEDSIKRGVKKEDSHNSAKLPEKAGMDWKIMANMTNAEIAAGNEKIQEEKEITDRYEKEMGYNPLPWWTDKGLTRLMRFLMDKSPEDVQRFAAWSKAKYSVLTPAKARMNPAMVIDLWPQAFTDNPEDSKYEYFKPDPREKEYIPCPY